jgi:hypothetical protein
LTAEERKKLIDAQNELISIQDSDGRAFFNKIKVPSSNSYNAGTSYECDLYFKPAAESLELRTTEQLLSGAVSTWTPLTSITEDDLTNKWILIEITQGPHLFVNKLWQLERAVRLLPIIDKSIVPGALVILMNGNFEEAESAIKLIKIPSTFKITQYPLFVGWVKSRNLFTTLNIMENDIKSLTSLTSSKVESLTSIVDSFTSDMSTIKSLLSQLLQK